jgi:hypothetical protein
VCIRIQLSRATVKELHSRLQHAYQREDVRLSYDQKLWMRVEAAYPGDGPDHPPYKKEWIRHATRYRDSFSTSTAQR